MEVAINYTHIVDEYAAVKAAMADLQEKEDALKAILIASQERQLKGTSHKVSVSWICPKPTTDFKGVVDYLRVGKETLDLFQVEKQPYVTVRVYGR